MGNGRSSCQFLAYAAIGGLISSSIHIFDVQHMSMSALEHTFLMSWLKQSPSLQQIALPSPTSLFFCMLGIITITYLLKACFQPTIFRSDLASQYKHMQSNRKLGINIPPPFPNGWFFLCASSDLKAKQVKSIDCLGQNLVLFRGESGKPALLHAYCPHLGANLGIEGTVTGDSVVCAFHGFAFNGEGKCTGIQFHPPGSEPPALLKTQAWPVMEINRGIYMYFHADNEEPTWFPDPINGVDGPKDKSWVYHGDSEHIIPCHIQEIPENGSDVSHLGVLHKDFPILPNIFQHRWKGDWKKSSVAEHFTNVTVDQTATVFKRYSIPGSSVHVDINQIGPGIVHLNMNFFFGKVAIIETVTPLGPLLQRVTHTIFTQPHIPRLLAKLIFHATVYQFSKDGPIWSTKQFIEKPFLVKGDGPITAFRRHYSQFYSNGSKKFSINPNTNPKSLDW